MILIAVALLLILLSLVLISSFKIGWKFYLPSICKIKTGLKDVVLTFDDGPHPEYTPKLLDLLKEKGIHATFFVVGERANRYPEIVKRLAEDGHKLGIHSYYHKPSFTLLSKRATIKDLSDSKTLLEKITGDEISLFRPPYGVTNPNIAGAVKSLKLKSIGWSIRSFDTVGKSEDKVVDKIERSLSPGAIILLHDRLPDCVSLVSKLLTVLDNKGYKVVNL